MQGGTARHQLDQRRIGPVAVDQQDLLEAVVGDALGDIEAEGDEDLRLDVHGAGEVDVMLVVGAQNSSNSNRLREIGDEIGVPSYLIDDANGLDLSWLAGSETLGISAGASAPEELVTELIERLRSHFVVELQHVDGVKENVQFRLPSEITDAQLDLASLRNKV